MDKRQDNELLTAGQLALRLFVSRSTIERWARAGRIPVIRLSDRVNRLDWSAVLRAVKSMDSSGG